MLYKGVLVSLGCILAVIGIAKDITFDTINAWTGASQSSISRDDEDGAIVVRGRVALISKASFPVEADKTYTLKGSFKAGGTENSKMYFGFCQYDKNGKMIETIHTDTMIFTDTELIQNASASARELKVKNAMKWKTFSTCVIAYDTDPSYRDLPNFNILDIPVRSTKKQSDGSWVISLSRALGKELPAGTKLRQHTGKGAGYMYTGGYLTTSQNWQTIQGSARGYLDRGFSFTKWAPGAVTARVVVCVNWNDSKASTELKDISLSITDQAPPAPPAKKK